MPHIPKSDPLVCDTSSTDSNLNAESSIDKTVSDIVFSPSKDIVSKNYQSIVFKRLFPTIPLNFLFQFISPISISETTQFLIDLNSIFFKTKLSLNSNLNNSLITQDKSYYPILNILNQTTLQLQSDSNITSQIPHITTDLNNVSSDLYDSSPITNTSSTLNPYSITIIILRDLLFNLNPVFVEDTKSTFEKKHFNNLYNGKVAKGTISDKKSFPCPFRRCFYISNSKTNFKHHLNESHNNEPTTFIIIISKFQIQEKKIIKEFISNLNLDPQFKNVYGIQGSLSRDKKTQTFIYTCKNNNQSFLCPACIHIVQYLKPGTYKISLNVFHNHQKYIRRSLSKESCQKIYHILLENEQIANKNRSLSIDQLLNKILDTLALSDEDPIAYNAIVTKSYIQAVLSRIRKQQNQPKNFIPLFMKPFEDLEKEKQTGIFGRFRKHEFIEDVILLIPPQIIKSQQVFKPITRSNSIKNNSENSFFVDGFVSMFALKADLEDFFLSTTPQILVADATHNINSNHKAFKLFTICRFDGYLNRIPIVSMIIGSEKQERLSFCLEKLKLYATSNSFTFPPIKYILTDLARGFINSFKSTFQDVYNTNTISWYFCQWHSINAVMDKIDKVRLPKTVFQPIKTQFLFVLYSRGSDEFENEKTRLVTLLHDFLTNNEIEKITKSKIQDLINYFEVKFTQSSSWAYTFRQSNLINLNMSLERYHEEIKKRWPSNGAPSINIAIETLFGVWNNERSRRIGFNTNPTQKNMSYRMLMGLKERQISDIKERFVIINSNIITLDNIIKLVENIEESITIHEGRKFMELSKKMGPNKLVCHVVLKSVGSICSGECDLYDMEAEVCLHNATCTCDKFYVKKILCRHILFVAKLLIFQNTCDSKSDLTTGPVFSIPEAYEISDIEEPKEIYFNSNNNIICGNILGNYEESRREEISEENKNNIGYINTSINNRLTEMKGIEEKRFKVQRDLKQMRDQIKLLESKEEGMKVMMNDIEVWEQNIKSKMALISGIKDEYEKTEEIKKMVNECSKSITVAAIQSSHCDVRPHKNHSQRKQKYKSVKK